ncbi:chromosome partitioning protein [Gammaproteobacteria bacterium]
MAKIIAVTNQKGGVGKTTTSVNLAASLAANQHRVLLVDLDPQGNATMGSGVDKNHLEKGSSYEVVMGTLHLSEVAVSLSDSGYVLLPANGNLTAAEVELLDAKMREQRLRLALAQVRDKYDFILVDCPPSLNMLTVNALVAAHAALIPIQCEYYALEGLTALISTIEKIRIKLNPKLRIAGLLRTMFDPRNNLANEVSVQLLTHFREQVYTTIIPRNVRLAEAPSHGQPVLLYDRGSRGSLAYMALASEVARREAGIPAS